MMKWILLIITFVGMLTVAYLVDQRRTQRVAKTQLEGKDLKNILSSFTPQVVPGHRWCGILVEPRNHHNLLPVLRNFRAKFPHAPAVVLHGTQTEDLLKALDDPLLLMHSLGVDNLTIRQYNVILTSPELYNLVDTEYVLVFQTDSVFFSKSTETLDPYMNLYDYVGAPWRWQRSGGGNGGLSLRRQESMIEITQRYPYLESDCINEDMYFSVHLRGDGYRLPTKSAAARLFFEHMNTASLPLGAHKYLPKKHVASIEVSERNILANNHRKKPEA